MALTLGSTVGTAIGASSFFAWPFGTCLGLDSAVGVVFLACPGGTALTLSGPSRPSPASPRGAFACSRLGPRDLLRLPGGDVARLVVLGPARARVLRLGVAAGVVARGVARRSRGGRRGASGDAATVDHADGAHRPGRRRGRRCGRGNLRRRRREWRTTSTPAVVPPPTSATATSAFAAIAPPVAAAAPPPPAPAEPKAAPSAASLSPSVGSTGRATASVLRCSGDLLAERAAARALAQVAVQRRAPQRAAAEVRELLADLLARRLTRRPARDQRGAGLEHERLHLLPRDVEHRGDLVVRDGAELGEHQRGPLVLGQRRDVAEQLADVLAPLRLGRQVLGGRRVELVERQLAAGAQHREAAVARDRVEPRPELDLRSAAHEVAVGGHERVLDRVLRLVGRGQHVAAEREDAAVVAVIDRLEGRLAPAAHERDEPLVGGDAQQHGRPWTAAGARETPQGRRIPHR